MGFFDKIKNLFKFGKDKQKALPEPQNIQNRKQNDKSITLTRKDGSQITLEPRCDRVGNQCFKSVIHPKTGEMHLIPEFTISDEFLKEAQSIHGSTFTNILMEIDLEQLKNNEEYQYQVANVLLNPKRMPQVIDNNQHYAGTVTLNNEGKLESKCSPNIIKSLSEDRIKSDQMRFIENNIREKNNNNQIRNNAINHEVNIKSSHAEDLNKYVDQGEER